MILTLPVGAALKCSQHLAPSSPGVAFGICSIFVKFGQGGLHKFHQLFYFSTNFFIFNTQTLDNRIPNMLQ